MKGGTKFQQYHDAIDKCPKCNGSSIGKFYWYITNGERSTIYCHNDGCKKTTKTEPE